MVYIKLLKNKNEGNPTAAKLPRKEER